MKIFLIVILFTLFLTVACDSGKNTLKITATSYTSHAEQTDTQPT